MLRSGGIISSSIISSGSSSISCSVDGGYNINSSNCGRSVGGVLVVLVVAVIVVVVVVFVVVIVVVVMLIVVLLVVVGLVGLW